MTTMTAALPSEGVAFLESLPQELRDLIEQAGLTWEDLRELLNPRVVVDLALPWI